MEPLNFMSIPGWIALISSFLVLGQAILNLIFGSDLDMDVSGDGLPDFDLGTLVSPKGILHFLFGSSWYLVLVREPWNWVDYLVSIGVGIIVALLVALIYWALSRLASEKKKETGEELVGRAGTIYLNTGKGTYDITIVSSGATTTIQAKSSSGKKDYRTGEKVVIEKYENDIYFIN